MAQEIVPGVFWLDGDASNLYLCVEDDGLTLIDAGMPRRDKLVWELLDQLGRPRTDLKRILLTHADLDHTGSTAVLQAESGAKVYAGPETAQFLPTGKSPKHLPSIIHFFASLMKYKAVSAATIEVVQDGDVLPMLGGLQALATPGHTSDHFSFFSPSTGVLFAGDALNTRDGSLKSTPPRITADQKAARQSALRLLELAPTVFACGHGTPLQDPSSEDLQPFLDQLNQE